MVDTDTTRENPFTFAVRSDETAESLTLEEVVYQAIGAGSMCWESMAGTGVFQDRQACDIAEAVLAWVRANMVNRDRPKAGDRVVDGGIPGVLVRCRECSGDGLLHQADPGAEPTQMPAGETA